jgi:DNA-binding response OmpR family regulator
MGSLMIKKYSETVDSSSIRVIVVEEDAVFLDLIVMILKKLDYDVIGVSNSAALYRELIDYSFDIVLLDADLSGDDSFAITHQLRAMQRTRLLGIILLFSNDQMLARVEGLRSGADVCMRKPVNPQQIHAQIQSLYRRISLASTHSGGVLWRFCLSEWTLVTPSGAEIELTHLETKVMHILALHSGQPVSRQDIISTALNQNPLAYDERRLEALISRLRKKIAKKYFASQPIKAAHSVGYMFSDQVEMN